MHDADTAMGDEKCGDRRCKEDKFDVKHGRRLRGHSQGHTEFPGPSTLLPPVASMSCAIMWSFVPDHSISATAARHRAGTEVAVRAQTGHRLASSGGAPTFFMQICRDRCDWDPADTDDGTSGRE